MHQNAHQAKTNSDPVLLEIIWSRLIAICDQSAATLTRTAFSTLIRECNDYTCVLLDKDNINFAVTIAHDHLKQAFLKYLGPFKTKDSSNNG